MTNDTRLLVGSLSNDLFRVASLTHRGSLVAAKRFFIEAQRWAQPLQDRDISAYIRNIATEILATDETDLSTELAERYLMYGILLQNYALHKQKFSADVLSDL